jgi:DNA-binding CsgD family transcriptional regulator
MAGFDALKSDEPLMVELEEFTENNDQFFYFGDLLQMKIFLTSKRSYNMMGVEPAEFTPGVFFAVTHPDDLERMGLARAKLFKIASDLFVAKNGFEIMSTNYKLKNQAGNYANILNQLFIFYSTTPYKSVFLLKIHTNIGWYKKLNHGFHYYLGRDISNFRFPDEKLLMLGDSFSEREFEIIKLIASGMSSEEVAEKIFLSVNTVNTHRRNILKKTDKATTAELIYDLMERGVI